KTTAKEKIKRYTARKKIKWLCCHAISSSTIGITAVIPAHVKAIKWAFAYGISRKLNGNLKGNLPTYNIDTAAKGDNNSMVRKLKPRLIIPTPVALSTIMVFTNKIFLSIQSNRGPEKARFI